jgi:hypothetical protein
MGPAGKRGNERGYLGCRQKAISGRQRRVIQLETVPSLPREWITYLVSSGQQLDYPNDRDVMDVFICTEKLSFS